jgi:O-antigen ligase
LGFESYFDLRYNDFSGDFDLEFGGIFASTNAFGILLFQTVALGIVSAIFSEGLARIFYYTCSVVLSLLVIQVNNRSSILCLVLMLVMLLIFYYKQYLATIAIAAGMVGFFILNSEILFNKLRLGQFEGERKLGNRTELFEEGLQIAGEMDFFGVGYYNQRKSRYTYGIADPNEHEMTFHNTYLATLVEFGYVGFLIFIGSIVYVIQRGIFSIKSKANRPAATLILCILLALMAGHSTVEDSFNFPGSPTFNFFWFQLLVLLALSDEPEAA